MMTLQHYIESLNHAQKKAVLTTEGAILVIAGAGSGKTRTIVHRLAHLIEKGVPASSILLLTFTKKVATEMIHRATQLLGQSIGNVQGGTFHSFAYTLLRQYHPLVLQGKNITVMDTSDSVQAIRHIKDQLAIGKGERSFPKNQTILSYISKARNKEIPIETILKKEAYHLTHFADDIYRIADAYKEYKEEYALVDYDDLLFVLEHILRTDDFVSASLQERYRYIMVDEYQDTNLVQARIVRLLAGKNPNVMVVGDDAQSIYAFRGADISNILSFPQHYENTTIIKLEQNYRSIQPILDITNAILDNAHHAYQKRLVATRSGDTKPVLMRTRTDISQSETVVNTIIGLLKEYPPSEIAVLFRAGYQSYGVEVQLNKIGIPFQKYGGSTYTEASHIKDIMAFLRLIVNIQDYPAFQRVTSLCKGIGEKTAHKIYSSFLEHDSSTLTKYYQKYPDMAQLLYCIQDMREHPEYTPSTILQRVFTEYQPLLETIYPDDWVRRIHGLEQLEQIASVYTDIHLFLSDISLHEMKEEQEQNDAIILSTVHSAKGLEWSAVIIIDLVEDRFPSKQSLTSADEYEEERRLLYVACTRAKDALYLFAPNQIYYKERGCTLPVTLSPFIRELDSTLYSEQKEQYTGFYTSYSQSEENLNTSASSPAYTKETILKGYCYHKQFGKGKILEELPDDKIRISFPNFGIKTIIKQYLSFE